MKWAASGSLGTERERRHFIRVLTAQDLCGLFYGVCHAITFCLVSPAVGLLPFLGWKYLELHTHVSTIWWGFIKSPSSSVSFLVCDVSEGYVALHMEDWKESLVHGRHLMVTWNVKVWRVSRGIPTSSAPQESAFITFKSLAVTYIKIYFIASEIISPGISNY